MVNYLYDLEKVENHREAFVGGKVTMSRSVAKAI
jgi:hypothetical protein